MSDDGGRGRHELHDKDKKMKETLASLGTSSHSVSISILLSFFSLVLNLTIATLLALDKSNTKPPNDTSHQRKFDDATADLRRNNTVGILMLENNTNICILMKNKIS
jgi:hypothetical protein